MTKTNLLLRRAALIALLPLVTHAQDTSAGKSISPEPTDARAAALDEVVVTASKTGETSVQSTPLAISVFSAEKLNSSLALNAKDLVSITPNLNVAITNASAQIYIRGIGSSNTSNGSDPDVTVQVDGVYVARAYGEFTDFIDVQRIEVLRGPQGTLYGRNAVGGVINIITSPPSDEFVAKTQLTGGTYSLFQEQAFVSGPLIPGKLQASITGNYYYHRPYIDNIVPGGHDIADADHKGARGQLRFIPTDEIEMITRADYNRQRDNFDTYDHLLAPVAYAPLATSTIGDYTRAALNSPTVSDVTLSGVSHEINVNLAQGLALKSLTAYRVSSFTIQTDSDATEARVGRIYSTDNSRAFSQEFNLTANLRNFEGVLGAYYFQEREISLNTSFSPPSPARATAAAAELYGTPDAHARSTAGFAQGTYHITDALSAVAGIRYTRDQKSLEQNFRSISLNPATLGAINGIPFVVDTSRTYGAWTPKYGLNYQFSADVLGFVSATKGFKSGGTNFAATSLRALNFGPETIWSYEAGIKSEWLDRRLRANVTAFHYDYKDLQVQSLLGAGLVAIGNAASAKVDGVEFETSAKPTPHLLLSANYALLNARYDEFTNASVPAALIPYVIGNPRYNPTTKTFDATGDQLNAAPRSSFSGSARYSFDLGNGELFVSGDYYRQSSAKYDPSNMPIMIQRPYGLVNAAIGYNSSEGKWGVQLVAKNLTDTHYLITIAANGVVPAGAAGAPQTFALQFTKTW